MPHHGPMRPDGTLAEAGSKPALGGFKTRHCIHMSPQCGESLWIYPMYRGHESPGHFKMCFQHILAALN